MIKALFFSFLFLSAFHGPSVSVFRVFHPSDHPFRQVCLVVDRLQCDFFFQLSCLTLSPYPRSLKSYFPGGCQSTFSLPPNGPKLLHRLSFKSTFFLDGLVTATPLYVLIYTSSDFSECIFLSFCIFAITIESNNCPITVLNFAM